jgi:hypothetical protein
MALTNPPVCAVCGETKDAPLPRPGRHILAVCDLVLQNADRCGYYAPGHPVADGHHPFIEAHCTCGRTFAQAQENDCWMPCRDQTAHRHVRNHFGVAFYLAIEDRIKAALHPKFYCPKCGCMLGGEGAPCVPCGRKSITYFVENFLSVPFAPSLKCRHGLLTSLVVSDIGGREAPLGTAKPTEPDHECAGEDVDMLEDESDDQTLQVDVPFAAERYATVIFPLDMTRAEANKVHAVLIELTEVPA